MKGGLSLGFSVCHVTMATYLLASSPSFVKRRRPHIIIKAQAEEIRVCTNRTCRRQGSMQTLETLSGLAPPNVLVKPCGCLGRCGAGPNLVALPDGLIVGHCGTAARAAEMMLSLCWGGCDATAVNKALEALRLTKQAQSEIASANFSQADLLLSQAIDINQLGGIHVIYKTRSVAKLAMGNHSGALEDARQALHLAPGYAEAYICQGDAFLAMDQYDLAEKSYATSLQVDPSIRRSKSLKVRIAKLREKLDSASMS